MNIPSAARNALVGLGIITSGVALYSTEEQEPEAAAAMAHVANDSGQWQLIGGDGRHGSWDAADGHNRVRALEAFQGDLYAGIGAGDSEVWRFAGGEWKQVGGQTIMNSWPARRETDPGKKSSAVEPLWVNVLLADEEGRYLYAGLKTTAGAQLWRFDGQEWALVGGQGGPKDWDARDYNNVYTLVWHEGKLHAGLQGRLPPSNDDISRRNLQPNQSSAAPYNRGDVYRLTATGWEKIAGSGFPDGRGLPDPTNWIYKLSSFKGDLYAAIGRTGIQNRRWTGEVWRLSDGIWTPIGGEGVNDSWNLPSTNLVTSMFVYNGKLLIGYNCQECVPEDGRFGNVWAWDGAVWEKLSYPVSCSNDSVVAHQRSCNDFALFDNHLVAGGGRASKSGHLVVWFLDDEDRWACLGEARMNRFTDPTDAALWEENEYVYSMTTYKDSLIVGFRGPSGTGHVWQYSGSVPGRNRETSNRPIATISE